MLYQKDYNYKNVMGATTDAELKLAQNNMAAQVVRMIDRQIVKALWDSCVKEGKHSRERDAILSMFTKKLREVMLGKHFHHSHLVEPWKMPGIQLYVSLLHYFENLTEVMNGNLIASEMEVMEASQTSSVHKIVKQFDKVINPIVQTFKKVSDFTDYFKASLQYEVIRKKAKAKGEEGRAWRKAYDTLCASIT